MALRSVVSRSVLALLSASFLSTAGCVGTSGAGRSLDEYRVYREAETAETLIWRLNQFALRFAAVTEAAADEIIARSEAPGARRRALLWKTEAIPACHLACFRPNPLAGLFDVWTLCVQLRDHFKTGLGKDSFGENQEIAVSACETLLAAADAMGKAVFSEEGSFEANAAMVRDEAKALPLGGSISSRLSPIEWFARYGQVQYGAMAAIASVEMQLRTMERHLQIYAEFLPKQARWQAEILAMDLLVNPDISEISKSLVSINDHGRNVARAIEDLKALVQGQVALILETASAERETIIESIATQRIEILKAIREERIAALEAIKTERAAALEAVDASFERTVNGVFSRVDDRLGRAIVWAAPAAGVALVLLALLVWAAARRRIVRVEVAGEMRGTPQTRE